jgi:uncharacterized membrane protein
MKTAFTEQKAEFVSGILVRIMVFFAAVVVLMGATVYLIKSGHGSPRYHEFLMERVDVRSVRGIILEAMKFDSRGIIQLGILLLIMIPVVRVAVFALTFILQRDLLYFVVTLIVFGILVVALYGI